MSLFVYLDFFHFHNGNLLYFYNRKIFSYILDKQNYKNEERREGRRKEGKREKKTSLEKSIVGLLLWIIPGAK